MRFIAGQWSISFNTNLIDKGNFIPPKRQDPWSPVIGYGRIRNRSIQIHQGVQNGACSSWAQALHPLCRRRFSDKLWPQTNSKSTSWHVPARSCHRYTSSRPRTCYHVHCCGWQNIFAELQVFLQYCNIFMYFLILSERLCKREGAGCHLGGGSTLVLLKGAVKDAQIFGIHLLTLI